MKRLIATQPQTSAHRSSFITHPKEGTIMKTRLFASIRRSALLVLALLSLNSSSALAQISQGPIDGALSFDGVDDLIEVQHNNFYNSHSVTIEARVRLDSLPAAVHTIIGKGDDGGSSGVYLNVDHDGAVQLWVFGSGYYKRPRSIGGIWVDGVTTLLTNPGEISPNQWHHIAGSFDPAIAQTTIYVDGSIAKQGIARVFWNNVPRYMTRRVFNTGPLTFGAQAGVGSHLAGQIDEVRFWNVVRSASEIADNRDQALNRGEPHLVGLWHMDDSPSELPTVANATDYADDGMFQGLEEVPEVVGQTVAQGVAMIQTAGFAPLRADFAGTDDPTLVGKIHWTQPAAGETLVSGGTVYYIEYRLE